MEYCVDHPDEIDKLAKVKAQTFDDKEDIKKIEEIFECLRDAELCQRPAGRYKAQKFRLQRAQTRRNKWFQNMKIKLYVLSILIALILIIVISVCGGFKC